MAICDTIQKESQLAVTIAQDKYNMHGKNGGWRCSI